MAYRKPIGSRRKIALLKLAEELGNVTRACRMMGVSRETFYRCKAAVEEGGTKALRKRRPVNSTKRPQTTRGHLSDSIERAAVAYALERPEHGENQAAEALQDLGLTVSPAVVRGAWRRHDLSCRDDRLRAVARRMADETLNSPDTQATARTGNRYPNGAVVGSG